MVIPKVVMFWSVWFLRNYPGSLSMMSRNKYVYVNTLAYPRGDHMPQLMTTLIGIPFFIYMLIGYLPLMRNWQELQAPHSYVARFYYYIIGLPAEGGLWLWGWTSSLSLFETPSSNTVFAILLMVIYSVLILFVYGVILVLLKEAGIRPKKVLMFAVLPFILLVIWDLYQSFIWAIA
jgi:hypothetical protein